MAFVDSDKHVAYCEDANEDTGSSYGGPKTYARSDEMPPPKNRPNVGRILTEQGQAGPRRSTSSPHRSGLTESDSTRSSKSSDKLRARDRDVRREKVRPSDSRRSSQLYESDREREYPRRRSEKKSSEQRERRSQEHSPTEPTAKTARPAVNHMPFHAIPAEPLDDYSRYAYQQPAAPPSRPRAQSRSATYYSGQPLAPPPGPGMIWHPFPQGVFPPGAFPGAFSGAFPPPGPGGPHGPLAPSMLYPPFHDTLPRGMPPPSPISVPHPGYFNGPPHPDYGEHLKSRFDSRPPSAMGAIGGPERLPSLYGPEDYGDESAPNVRRRLSRLSRGEEDRRKMPPPERIPRRTMSAAPQPNGPYRPPNHPQIRQNLLRSSSNRHSVNFGDEYDYEEFDPGQGGFQDMPQEPFYRQKCYREPARQGRHSKIYEDVDIIPAGRRSRPATLYRPGSLVRDGTKYAAQQTNSKLKDAQDYQDAVTGGPNMPLTAELLRKATRGNPGSQSTRSSGSRDDSEFRRSYSTGITRSSSRTGADEVTITVGHAVLTVQGGAQVTVSSSAQPRTRSESERSSAVYQIEDGRGQEREPPRLTLPDRTRAPSHSEQKPRGYLPGSYSPYEQPFAEGDYV